MVLPEGANGPLVQQKKISIHRVIIFLIYMAAQCLTVIKKGSRLFGERFFTPLMKTGFALLALLPLPSWSESVTDAPLELPVRVHLVAFEHATWLTSSLDREEIERLFAQANRVWGQAGISWKIESIINDVSQARLSQSDSVNRQVGKNIARYLPLNTVDARRWDVFFVRRLGNIPGFYHRASQSVVISEVDPFGGVGLDGVMARIFAHELGHSLGLTHISCTPQGNLMSPNCESANRTRLEQRQIVLARAVAELGRPYGAFVSPIAFILQRSDALELTEGQQETLVSIEHELQAAIEQINEEVRRIIAQGRAEIASGSPDWEASRLRRQRLAQLSTQRNALLNQSLDRMNNILNSHQRTRAHQFLQRYSDLLLRLRSDS